MTGSPSSPPRSDEGLGKSGVRLTTAEHLDRVEHLIRTLFSQGVYRETDEALESLTALRERIAEMESYRYNMEHARKLEVQEMEERIAAREIFDKYGVYLPTCKLNEFLEDLEATLQIRESPTDEETGAKAYHFGENL